MSHDWDLTPQQRADRDRASADAADPWKDHSRPLLRNAAGYIVQGPAPAAAQTASQKISDEEYAQLTFPEKIRYANSFPQR
jgi:hypothetical protein